MKIITKLTAIILTFTLAFTAQTIYAIDKEARIDHVEHYGGTGNDQHRSVIEDNGSYVAIGQSDSNDFNLQGMNKGLFDATIVAYNPDFSIKWKQNYGGSNEDYFRDITLDQDGYVAVGYSNSTNGDLQGLNKGSWDAVIVKYNKEGTIVWNKTFGGSYTDYFFSIATTPDGYIAVGQSSSTNQDLQGLNKGSFDGIIVKYDKDGNVIWNHNFGGNMLDRFYHVKVTEDGYIVVGNAGSNDQDLQGKNMGLQDAIIVKYDTDGNVVWNQNFGDTQNDYFYSVIPADTGYVAVGSVEDPTNSNLPNASVVKYDHNGNLVWDTSFGGSGSDIFYSLENTLGGYLIVGTSNSTNGNLEGLNKGNYDATIARFGTMGELLWNQNFGGSNYDAFFSVIPNSNGYTGAGYSTSKDKELLGLNYGRQDAIITNFRVPFEAFVHYSTQEPTKDPVTVTITTTEPIQTPKGWTKIDDTTFTKVYTENVIEDVLLQTLDGRERHVSVNVGNIIQEASQNLLLSILLLLLLAIMIMVLYYEDTKNC